MTRLFVFIFLLSGLAASLVAQTPEPAGLPDLPSPRIPLHFDHLTINDGLPQSNVYNILQDRNGFMWFGTQDGLSKYDGYTFTSYANDPEDPNSIVDSWITDLYEDTSGVLWVTSMGFLSGQGGLSRFDPQTETFTRYRHDSDLSPGSLPGNIAFSVMQDRQGYVWVGTGVGLHRFDSQTETFTQYQHDPDDSNSLSNNIVLSVMQDRQGYVWVGTGAGLNRFDPQTETFTRYRHEPNNPRSLSDDQVLEVFEDSKGNLWVATGSLAVENASTGGLIRFDPETDDFTRYMHDPADPASLSHNNIRTLFEDQAGTLWIGSGYIEGGEGGGLGRYDPVTDSFVRHMHDPNLEGSLGSNNVHAIYQDRQGLLWVGTGNGVSRAVPSGRRFEHYNARTVGLQGGSMRGIYEDRDGVLWMGTIEGILNAYNRTTGEITYYRHDPGNSRSIQQGWVVSIAEDEQRKLWMLVSPAGISSFDRSTQAFTHYPHDPANSNSPGPGANMLMKDSSGMFWISHQEGVDRLDPETMRFTHYTHSPDDSTTLAGQATVGLYEDDQGMIWMSHVGYLSRLDPSTGKAERYRVGSEDVVFPGAHHMQMRPQEPGVFWLASNALFRYDIHTGETTLYTLQNSGLSNNVPHAIFPDEDGNLWISTNNGLNRFNPDTNEWRVFGAADGLQSNEFNRSSNHKSSSGELFFGGINGVNAFFPDQIRGNSTPPQVALTDFKLFDQSVSFGDKDSPLQQPITETDALTLAYNQNDLSFDYVGLHYQRPEKNTYTYRLRGYDDAWREVGTRRTASFTNLPPGDYVFQVKAANADGVWNEEGRSLAITILPPWWRTTWAYILYGLMMLAGIIAVDRFQRRRLLRKERERAHKVLEQAHAELKQAHADLKATQAQLVQQEKLASLGQLTAGIAHEIKNPLNFINNFAEVNEELAQELREAIANGEDLSEIINDLEQNARIINQHGKRADGIVSAMMQHASGGTGQHEPTDLNAFMEEYVNLAYHGKRAQHQNLQVEIVRKYDEAAGKVELIPQEMGRVLLNLLGNAFDAVQDKTQSTSDDYHPTVCVQTHRQDDAIIIRVKDNGPGIPKNFQKKIFEPFFTTKPTGSGTGLGLGLSHDIVVQGHGGTLQVESTEGKGATFIVTLPG